jgi:glutamate N-acetyltransferase / amino-acid N-acetyltransferase
VRKSYCLPEGFMTAGISAGLKKSGKPDAGLIFSETPCVTAAMFTINALKAHHIIHAKQALKNGAKAGAVFVNSGNANVYNGPEGMAAVKKITSKIASMLGIKGPKVLMASTGKISLDFPLKKVEAKLPELCEALSEGDLVFPKAIMTTDLVEKSRTERVKIGGKQVTITGACKGSGMISINVATMLAFIMTDAAVSQAMLKKAVKEAVDLSFNRVTVDGDMSPNDTIYVMANGMAANKEIKTGGKDYNALKEGLLKVFYALSEEIAADGEGATKLLKFTVKNAASKKEAETICRQMANSPLVKTNFFGQALNFGRIISAVGQAGPGLDISKTGFYINGVKITDGKKVINHEKAAPEMKKKMIEVTVDLKKGKHGTFLLTCDYSYDYIRINADYT